MELDACPHCGAALVRTNERRLMEQRGFRTYAEAVVARDTERTRYHRGAAQAPLRMTLAQFLGKVWLPIVHESEIKTTTRESYDEHVHLHRARRQAVPAGPLRTRQ